MSARPPIPNPPYHGGCLCGQVRWTLTARPKAINACHCDQCKISTGSTHIEMLIASADAFTATGETQTYLKTAESGRQLEINRCSRCGTRVYHYNMANRTLIFIPAFTLDDFSWAIPTSHIWVEKISPGVAIRDDAVKVVGQPTDRQVLLDAFTKVYGA